MAGRTRKSSKNNGNGVDFKRSTTNFLLNIIIFLLAALIIFWSYSIFVKISDVEPKIQTTQSKDYPSTIIQLEVFNGCGVTGVADRFTDYLRNENFDVVNTENYITFDIDESIVIDRIGNMANAYLVAESLGINKKHVIQQLNDNYFVDVTVIIGKDYFSLKPIE